MRDALVPLVAHADWSSSSRKRWMARACLQQDRRYYVCTPEPVGETATLLQRLSAEAGPGGCVLLGVDFPIGLPMRYAERVGVGDFLAWLPRLGRDDWARFYEVAERPSQISLGRPFYPRRASCKGQVRLCHLLNHLGLETAEDLRRICERAQPGRRAASPLFWTVGGQQVGKAAISGWKEILGPALRSSDLDVVIWPFSGLFFDLFRPGRVVIAETYPAEFYTHLGMRFSARRPGHRSGKRAQHDRAANAPALLAWARAAQVKLAPQLRAELRDGFGALASGEDRFDAVVGLWGMLNVVLKRRPPGEPQNVRLRKIEGWILGQAA